jgi:hypothetical protein
MTNRRDLFKLSAGVATGAMLTPVPWRLIKDSSLLSENWPGIPVPKRGPITIKPTTCDLCPAACPLKARCVADHPVSLSGACCALGAVAHHLPYHPARLRQGPIEEARAKFAVRKPEARVAILDLAPEPPPYDFHSARTVISVGSNLLDGWAAPRDFWAARPNFRLIHVGAIQSATAMLADEWIRVAPGGEAAWLAHPTISTDGATIITDDAPALDSVADSAIDYLLIDESKAQTYIPWHEIVRTLAPGATVIVFTASRGGYARHATYALPTPVFPEGGIIPRPEGLITLAEFGGAGLPAGASRIPFRVQPRATSTTTYLSPWTPLLTSPLMTKLYEESNLRLPPNAVALHPDEARDVSPRATLQTRLGRCTVNVVPDPGVPRGAILAGSSPGIRDICGRNEEAKVVRA